MNEFLRMGGYGGYVWAAYGIALAVLALNIWWPRQSEKRTIREIRRELQRQTPREEDRP